MMSVNERPIVGRSLELVPEASATGRQGMAVVYAPRMSEERHPLEELRARIAEALRGSPVQDLEKNMNALLATFFDRFELASRDDLELQKKLAERAQAKLAALEARVAELEARKP